ncbi:hypothetical protein F7734_40205 [Scytonema sp. UIC 10036]|uniref:hypothetical protein n=1 Tax=Scytonema sp. UIC 10036 TaxID=2304196 RepID=UPI0012DA688D|nr:hypothetical protein [Scytonema sp. UIC 10036]MUG98204.1 hypothetical protein [Scytonema sp. UIC 10036]
MIEHIHQPQDFDAVLGGQAPPLISGVILGGIEGLRKRFATLTGERRTIPLANALQYGEAGIDLLVEAMNDKTFIVRATAYKLLQSVTSIKARQAVNNGLLLKERDKVYCVYQSAIYYQNETYYYICDYLPNDREKVESDYYYDFYAEYPQLISRHLFQENAELEAKILHQTIMLEINLSAIGVVIHNENFNIYRWCQLNQLSLDDFPEYEEPWKFNNRVLKKLQNDKNVELLEQLWELLGYTKQLAFVHEEVVQENQYFDFRGENFKEVF